MLSETRGVGSAGFQNQDLPRFVVIFKGGPDLWMVEGGGGRKRKHTISFFPFFFA